jgi:hypothetical protein
MAIEIDIDAAEKGTIVFTVSFFDEDDIAVTPSSITWHLTDINGITVNGLVDQAFTPPAEVIEIVLTGDDLALGGTPLGFTRVFSVEAPYNSTLGALVINEEARFDIENLVKIT